MPASFNKPVTFKDNWTQKDMNTVITIINITEWESSTCRQSVIRIKYTDPCIHIITARPIRVYHTCALQPYVHGVVFSIEDKQMLSSKWGPVRIFSRYSNLSRLKAPWMEGA